MTRLVEKRLPSMMKMMTMTHAVKEEVIEKRVVRRQQEETWKMHPNYLIEQHDH